jgi:hypothetical protein
MLYDFALLLVVLDNTGQFKAPVSQRILKVLRVIIMFTGVCLCCLTSPVVGER